MFEQDSSERDFNHSQNSLSEVHSNYKLMDNLWVRSFFTLGFALFLFAGLYFMVSSLSKTEKRGITYEHSKNHVGKGIEAAQTFREFYCWGNGTALCEDNQNPMIPIYKNFDDGYTYYYGEVPR